MSFPGLITLLFLAVSLSAQQKVYAPGELRRVVLVDGSQSIPMRDNVASRKGSWNVVVSKMYFVFRGRKAAVRTKTATPEFQFEADSEFDGTVYLFRLDVHSDSRELRIAKGSGGLAEMAIPKDHIVEARLEEIGIGANSTKRYRLKSVAPLLPGEYCLSRRISICYDFGVD